MEMEEQILAEGCREGEDTARRELYDRYAARLLAVCLRYSGDRATADFSGELPVRESCGNISSEHLP